MKHWKTGLIGLVAAAALATPLALTSSVMADTATPELGAPMSQAEHDAANRRIEACNLEFGLVDAEGNLAEDTRESREQSYECLHEGYPQYFSIPAQPVLAPPGDWQPDAGQIEYQDAFTAWLSGVLTDEGIEHEVVEHVTGVTFVDFDQFDPDTADGVSEVISRGDHFPGGAADLPEIAATPARDATSVPTE